MYQRNQQHGGGTGVPSGQRGDPRNWFCPMCQNENFPTRQVCNKKECNYPRPYDPNGNWTCPLCNNDNYPQRTQCNNKQCGAAKPNMAGMSQVPPVNPQQPQGGQITSFSSPYGYSSPGAVQQPQYPGTQQSPYAMVQQAHGMMQQQPQLTGYPGTQQHSIQQLYQQHQQQTQQQQQMPAARATRVPFTTRPGDWLCPVCNNHNYASRDKCNGPGCDQVKPQQPHAIISPTDGGYGGAAHSVQVPAMQYQQQQQHYRQHPYMQQYQPQMQQRVQQQQHMQQQPQYSGGNKPPLPQKRVGDWVCPQCSNHNYASREKCNGPGCEQMKVDCLRWVCPHCNNDNYPQRAVCNQPGCQQPRPENAELVNDRSEIGKKRSRPGDPDNWRCEKCGNENFPTRTQCNRCQEPRTSSDDVAAALGTDGLGISSGCGPASYPDLGGGSHMTAMDGSLSDFIAKRQRQEEQQQQQYAV